MTTTTAPEPFAAPGSRFVLAGSTVPAGSDRPSPIGLRPWGLRRACAAGAGRPVPAWCYDHDLQLAVDTTGRPLIDALHGDPSADTTSRTDGEDGPSSEDWNND
jgi:putative ATP-grasp target RiPP